MTCPAAMHRRAAIQAGSIGLLGFGLADLLALRSRAADATPATERSVIFVFLTGGISHQDSFDLKPDAPVEVRGEFKPISTRTTGMQICEHLPLLAARSEHYALVRSVGTNSSGHEEACHMLLTGRLDLPPGFSVSRAPSPNEWPTLASQVTYSVRGRNKVPPAVVLPQPSVNEAGKVRPGQYAGRLGSRYEPWRLNVAAQCTLGNGACPNCFRFDPTPTPFKHESAAVLEIPKLTLPEGGASRFQGRLGLLADITQQQRALDQAASSSKLDRYQQQAISVLSDPAIRAAFDVENAEPAMLERYGKNKFGMSLLMARQLVQSGVRMVQVNLGKNSSWDTHRRNFINLKDNLFPYFDRGIAALLDDLSLSGLLESTLVVVTGEFGRTPIINKDAGRDHWGPAMTVMFAGAGVRGGTVIGATDKIAAYPVTDRFTPENIAATMFETLGIPRGAEWHDTDGRPFQLYCGRPIRELYA